jgi:multidrug transporter EmrE-like cation transporter
VKDFFLIVPIAILVAYSQIIVKWRSNYLEQSISQSFLDKILKFLSDPFVISAYSAALFASFSWLYIVTKLPLTIAFPVYIGITFVMVLVGGWFFLSEPLTIAKIIAIIFILTGIVIGMVTHD